MIPKSSEALINLHRSRTIGEYTNEKRNKNNNLHSFLYLSIKQGAEERIKTKLQQQNTLQKNLMRQHK